MPLTLPNGNETAVSEKADELFSEEFRELFFQLLRRLLEAVGVGLSARADFCGDGILAQAHLPKPADLHRLGHDFVQPGENLPQIQRVRYNLLGGGPPKVGCLLLQLVQPVHFATFLIDAAGVERTDVAGGAVGAGPAVHVAHEPPGRRAYAAPVILLGAAVGVDVAVVVAEFFFGAEDALPGGVEVNVVLLVIGFHIESSVCRFLETEDSGRCRKTGMGNLPQSKRISPFRSAANPLKRQLLY